MQVHPRLPSLNLRLNFDSATAMDAPPVDHRPPCSPNPPLSTALSLVLLESGSHGMTVCEALRKLLRRGFSKLLDSDGRPRAVQVKMALRRCPDIKEVDSRRFVLRRYRQAEQRKRICNGVLQQQSRGGTEACRLAKGFLLKDPCRKQQIPAAFAKQVISCGELNCHLKEGQAEQCRKTDGKHWRCSQQTKPGMLYCEHHRQRRSKAINRTDNCRDKNYRLLQQDQNLRPVHTEGDSPVVDEILPGKSIEQSEVGDGPKRRCHRNDGKHWQCSKQVKSGSAYCEHHQGRNKRGLTKGDECRRVLVAKEANQPKLVPKPLALDNDDQKLRSQTLADVLLRKSNEQSQTGDGFKLERCHRNDGKQWQCSKRVKSGSIYCEYHLGRTKRGKRKSERILAAKEENQGEQVQEKVKGSVHAQITLLRESKHVLACAVGSSQAKEVGNVVQETRQRHYLESSPFTTKPNGSGHELTKSQVLSILPAYTIVARSLNAIHQWKEKPNQNGLTDVRHTLQLSTIETKSNQHGQAIQERHASQHNKVAEHRDAKEEVQDVAFHLGSSSTTLHGCCSVARSADVQTKDEQWLEQCHRRDGKGWQCSQKCKPGYIYCEHHHGKRSKERGLIYGQQKPVVLDNEVSATCLKHFPLFNDNGVSVNSRDFLNQMEELQKDKTCIKGRYFKQEQADQQQSKRCHRKDGKGWQCSRQAKHGFNLCEHHQIYVSRRTILKASKKEIQSHGSTHRSWSEMLTMGCSSVNEISKSRTLCMQPLVL